MGSIRSMTGFSRSTATLDSGAEVTVEVRSVNHRFLEVNLKAPRCYSQLERDLKTVFHQAHRRGRIDVTITRTAKPTEGRRAEMEFAKEFDDAVRAYVAACRRFGASGEGVEAFVAQLLLREVVVPEVVEEVTPIEVTGLLGLLGKVSGKLSEMRIVEGEALAVDVANRLSTISRYRGEILQRGLTLPIRLRERLHERINALAPEVVVNPERLAQEVALIADRIDITEELSRLDIHLSQFRVLLREGSVDGIGRKLDFMTQEVGRELNTIGSKAQDAYVQGLVVEAKAELERIREQVQNIE